MIVQRVVFAYTSRIEWTILCSPQNVLKFIRQVCIVLATTQLHCDAKIKIKFHEWYKNDIDRTLIQFGSRNLRKQKTMEHTTDNLWFGLPSHRHLYIYIYMMIKPAMCWPWQFKWIVFILSYDVCALPLCVEHGHPPSGISRNIFIYKASTNDCCNRSTEYYMHTHQVWKVLPQFKTAPCHRPARHPSWESKNGMDGGKRTDCGRMRRKRIQLAHCKYICKRLLNRFWFWDLLVYLYDCPSNGIC